MGELGGEEQLETHGNGKAHRIYTGDYIQNLKTCSIPLQQKKAVSKAKQQSASIWNRNQTCSGTTMLDNAATVSVTALSAGWLTLPERFFVHPASETAVRSVPSLSFLIQHKDRETGKTTRILFDLGLRKDLDNYIEPIRKHVATRQPISTDPDVCKSLAAGGLTPDDIDYVMYSHVRRPPVSIFKCPLAH